MCPGASRALLSSVVNMGPANTRKIRGTIKMMAEYFLFRGKGIFRAADDGNVFYDFIAEVTAKLLNRQWHAVSEKPASFSHLKWSSRVTGKSFFLCLVSQ